MKKLTSGQSGTLATVRAAHASRRSILKSAAAIGAVGLLSPAFVRKAFSSSGELNWFTWEDYAPQALVARFEKDTGIKLKKRPTEYLRTMYYDTLVFTSEALRHLAAEVGSSQLVIGTDHPIPWQDKSVDHILNTPGFTDAERRAMLGETAAKLLGIKL